MHSIEAIQYISMNNNYVIYTSLIEGKYTVNSLSLKTKEKKVLFSSNKVIKIISYINKNNNFIFEKKDNETCNIYMYKDGNIQNLTPNQNSYFLKLNKEDQILYFESNIRDEKYMDVYSLNLQTGEIKLHFNNINKDIILSISDNGENIILSNLKNSNSKIKIENLNNNSVKILDDGVPQFFIKDCLYILTTDNHNYQYLKVICLNTLKVKKTYKHHWDIILAINSPCNNYLSYITNENGVFRLNIYDLTSNTALDMSFLPKGTIKSLSFSDDEKNLVVLIEKSNTPGDLYNINLKKYSITKLTNVTGMTNDKNIFIEGNPIKYKNKKGITIYGQLYLSNKSKSPLIILVHGGPGGQFILNFDILIQFLCLSGYSVFAINHRGSSGYGKDYLNSIDGEHGIEDLKDCIEAKDYFKNNPNIDLSKVGIIGISYGATLSLSSLAFFPGTFRFAINLFGVYNWLNSLKNLPESWDNYKYIFYRKIGHPTENPDHLKRISPYYHISNIDSPVMFISGGKDIRNNKDDLNYIVEKLKKRVPVYHLSYEEEGHGLNEYNNIIDCYTKIYTFIREYFN